MKYFYDKKTDSVFAYAADGSQDEYIADHLEPIPESKAMELSARPPKMSDDDLDAMRRNAYMLEADPLFFKWQRGEVEKSEWLAKVNEIKQRWPDV